MTVSVKDSLKFVGIAIIACCAVFVCNLFLNYDADLRAVADLVTAEGQAVYKAQKMNNTVVCAVSGICLALTSVVMLIFYIGQYIQANSAKFGILKAIGYSDGRIALTCSVFGFCVFVGAAVGFGLSWAVIPRFYRAQNGEYSVLPRITYSFHAYLPVVLVLLPTLVFSALSVGIAYKKLGASALSLIRGERPVRHHNKFPRDSKHCFLVQFAFNILNEKKSLAFFIAFGGFCFAAMLQMGLSMRDYASEMMGIMVIIIGVVLAATSLYLAMSTVVGGNAKKIAMLKVNGYGLWESGIAVLGMYSIPSLIGFAIGSVYQYAILEVMVNIVFSSVEGTVAYSFDWTGFGICLAVFVFAYAALNAVYTLIIARTPVKTVMSE